MELPPDLWLNLGIIRLDLWVSETSVMVYTHVQVTAT